MFNLSSWLSRVIRGDKVYVGKAIQKVVIIVDEEGTEATGGIVILLTTVTLISCKVRYKKNTSKTQAIQTLIADDEHEETGLLNMTFDLTGDLRKNFAVRFATSHVKFSIICSPTSALLPLGKLALGAEGETEKQILQAIGIDRASEINGHFKGLIEKLMMLQGVHLNIASQLYVNRNRKLKRNFHNLVTDIFPTGVSFVDMSDSTEVANTINNWISEQTNNKIKNLIKLKDISSKSNLIVVNAIYFKGKWKIPFEEVKRGTFYRQVSAVTLPMMSVEDYFMYMDSDVLDAQVIKIPYEKEEVSFCIYLPRQRNGLPKLMKKLKQNPELLNSVTLRRRKIQLKIPKFNIQTEFNLKQLYKRMGLTEIFDMGSGLKEMLSDGPVYVDEAIQRAIIEVTEEGTTAAASSAMQIVPLSYIASEAFIANHPFLFFIVANKEQLFSGVFIGDGKDAQPLHRLLRELQEILEY